MRRFAPVIQDELLQGTGRGMNRLSDYIATYDHLYPPVLLAPRGVIVRRNRISLAQTDRLNAGRVDTVRREVIADRISATLRELQVVVI